MDDILTGEATIEDAKKLQAQICHLFLRAGFELYNWVSNSPDLLQDLSTSFYTFDKGHEVGPLKTLDLQHYELEDNQLVPDPAYVEELKCAVTLTVSDYNSEFYDDLFNRTN
ncbi:hypothetical protein AVEN_66644-1 [Araneus ventricosus]|uniref:Uncharacterized protein n=1 Tax=Araneus ventricosus TaxID=182803 RepID=A0A4Y2M7F9_ARAVE|nr:hypothetical protein AVEN_66644-1 [Araneus ventricosus]